MNQNVDIKESQEDTLKAQSINSRMETLLPTVNESSIEGVKAVDRGDFYVDYFIADPNDGKKTIIDATKKNFFREQILSASISTNVKYFLIIGLVIGVVLFFVAWGWLFMLKESGESLVFKDYFYAATPLILALVFTPLYRKYCEYRTNKDLDSQYTVQWIIEMKESKFEFPSTVNYVSRVYSETGQLTLFDLMVAEAYVELAIQSAQDESAKNSNSDSSIKDFIKKSSDEAKAIHTQVRYISKYVIEY